MRGDLGLIVKQQSLIGFDVKLTPMGLYLKLTLKRARPMPSTVNSQQSTVNSQLTTVNLLLSRLDGLTPLQQLARVRTDVVLVAKV